MTITQIKYFITAAKYLSFTKAADKLFITQPALSRQIASIEMELNMQLFIRNNLYKTPTVRFLDVDQVSDLSLTLAWNVDNYNPMKEIFKDNFKFL